MRCAQMKAPRETPEKITFAVLRSSGVHGVLIFRSS